MCNCEHCRFSRGEISKDYYVGYLKGCIESDMNTLNGLKKLGFEATGLSAEQNTIGFLMAVIDCNLDEYQQVLDFVLKTNKE